MVSGGFEIEQPRRAGNSIEFTPFKRISITAGRSAALRRELEDVRQLDMDNVKPYLMRCTVEDFLNLFPLASSSQLGIKASLEVEKRLLSERKFLCSSGWTLLIRMLGEQAHEDDTYSSLQGLSQAVAKAAIAINPSLEQTTAWQSSGAKAGKSDAPGHIWKPDSRCILVLCLSPKEWTNGTIHVPRQPSTSEWSKKMAKGDLISVLDAHCAATGEFKKTAALGAQSQDERQTVGGATFVLYNDPRRRFIFSITIEKSLVRLWRFDRARVLVSNPFDCHRSPLFLIRFIMLLMFSQHEDLGYDTSIRRFEVATGIPYFVYSIKGRKFRTKGPPLYDSGAALLVSRGVRAWLVDEISKDGKITRANLVLKDYWAFENLAMELDIQRKILEILQALDEEHKSHGPLSRVSRMKKYFLTIVLEGDVLLQDDRTPDMTLPIPSGAVESTFLSATMTSRDAPLRSSADRDIGHDAPRHEASIPHVQPMKKVHRQVVYEENCTTLYEQENARDVLRLFAGFVDALNLLREAGYVHQDISGGNCLAWRDPISGLLSAKLTDLESCQPFMKKENAQNPISTTREFLAVEPFCQKLYFGPRTDERLLASFYYHPWHDLEALSWLSLYWIMSHFPSYLDGKNEQRWAVFKAKQDRWREQCAIYFGAVPKQPHLLEESLDIVQLIELGWAEAVVSPLKPVITFSEALGKAYSNLQAQRQRCHPDKPNVQRWSKTLFTGELYQDFQERLEKAACSLPPNLAKCESIFKLMAKSSETPSSAPPSGESSDKVLGNWPRKLTHPKKPTSSPPLIIHLQGPSAAYRR